MTYLPGDLRQVPRASALCESLRSLGYTLGSAVADLIDNSVAASARNVWISLAATDANKRRLTILDDGSGMSPEVLLAAMRPGSRNPLDSRDRADLGRFGLGLKTASFSQCRCLTVATRDATGATAVLRWDLDHIARTDSWDLLEGSDPDFVADLAQLDSLRASGTLIVWSKLDRLPKNTTQAVGDLGQHLSLTFHRMIEERSLTIGLSMNPDPRAGSPLVAADPFLRGNHATRPSPVQMVERGCSLRGYVLPHRDLCSDDEWDRGALGTTWRDRQGCYLYRSRRLLVAGGWLGLDRRWRKDAETQLARIQIDFDNTWDERWELNVMKSRATPPEMLRERLRRLAEVQRAASANVYRYRHRRAPGARPRGQGDDVDHVPLWRTEEVSGRVRFSVSEDHPAVRRLCGSSPLARPVLNLIAETLPAAAIWSEFSKRVIDGADTSTIRRSAERLRIDLLSYVEYERANGRGLHELLAEIRLMEPYDQLPDIVESVAAELGVNSAPEGEPAPDEQKGRNFK